MHRMMLFSAMNSRKCYIFSQLVWFRLPYTESSVLQRNETKYVIKNMKVKQYRMQNENNKYIIINKMKN